MGDLVDARREVKKHVATIHTSGELSLIERKLVNVLLLNSFDNLTSSRRHSIPVYLLSELVGWGDSKNLENLKKALSRLTSTSIQFNLLGDGKDEWTAATLVAGAQIKDGICTYEYSSFLAEKMANPDVYATINVAIQNDFAGGYALSLYENCKRFHKVGSTGFIDVETWRTLLGAKASMYDEFRHFSNHVIKKAVAEINQVSDIHITPEFQRQMRKVTHIKFLIIDNPQRTIYTTNSTVRFDEIRASATYLRLMSHAIGDKLAVTWLSQESEEKINEKIDYVEQKDRLKQVRGSTGGYIRTLVETKAVTSESDYQKKKKVAANRSSAEAEADVSEQSARDEQEKNFKAQFKALNLEQRQAYAASYLKDAGIGREKFYTLETGRFKAGEPNLHFIGWLRTKLKI